MSIESHADLAAVTTATLVITRGAPLVLTAA